MTKEKLKERILNHLKSLASKSTSVEDFSLSKIQEATKSGRELVTEALDELSQEGRVDSHIVHMEVYIPHGKDGQRILEKLAESGFLTYSPYLSVLVGLAVIYLVINYYPYPLAPTQYVTTLNEAYSLGIKNGILYAFVAGVVGGLGLQWFLIRFKQWKILSVHAYEVVAKMSKRATLVFIALLGGYWVVAWWTLRNVDPTMVVALLGIAVTISLGIQPLLPKPSKRSM